MKDSCNKPLYRAAFLVFLFASIALFPASAHALVSGEKKLMGGRFGLGYTNQIATTTDRTIPAIDAKYFLSDGTAVSLGVGFDTRANDGTTALGLKAYKNIFFESNLNFYAGVGAAYVNRLGSKMQFSAFLGSEFFFDRLPSLGFSFEFGVRGDKTTGDFAIRTTGDSFLTAGIHFYL